MKRILIWMPVGVATFLVGLTISILFYYASVLPSTMDEVVAPADKSDCRPTSGFPGKSRHISTLHVRESEYFPYGAYSDGWKGREASINYWYGKHLRAMGEESLVRLREPESEVYRFIWLRTFHHPVIVRLERTPHGATVVMKETDGQGGYEPGKLIVNRQIELTREEWCIFSQLIEDINYWNQPLELDAEGGNDGAQWILEGVRENRYTAVDRWSPDPIDSPIRQACMYLLELGDIETANLGHELY
jgi:hypothetical protein